ncbi:putative peptidase [Haloferula luteola]|uniref:Putative peptidase n=1 Tax=Haloferula luteola TaxID=595692 RepID=A0A840V7R2_9BACT|nr:dienelactone hydrolase family protein [Haloferula luteola]MBB5349799.1 putative peptidase [Haloferula luteola]
MKRLSSLATAALMGSACQLHAAELQEKSFTSEATPLECQYLLSIPDGEAPEAGWPLIMFLHGAGERGTHVHDVERHGPPKLLAEGKSIPAIVVAPQCSPSTVWNPHLVKALTDKIAAEESVDSARIYLTGLSMGGFGTWDTATEFPETYAAIAPICGGAGIRFLLLPRIAKTPCWIFHGEDDPVVNVEFSRSAFEALQRLGAPVKLTVYPKTAHDSWTRTYEDPQFWEWLFAQKR